MFYRLLIGLFFSILAIKSVANPSIVVLQYHNVGSDTPRSTSVTLEELASHITWLRKHHFQILALDKALEQLQNPKTTATARIAAITFDDSHKSVCLNAWPYLKQENIPFTVFINSDAVAKHFGNQCTKAQLKNMSDSGLVIIGNHGRDHAHLLDRSTFDNRTAWLDAVKKEVLDAESFIQENFGPQPKFFAYPYGEYNQDVENIIRGLGYIGFGQQSGAIGKGSNFNALPRFPLSGSYANLKTITNKLNSLAFPAKIEFETANPVKHVDNPPKLTLQLTQNLHHPVQCFLSNGTPLPLTQKDRQLIIKAPTTLKSGRERYNCTALSEQKGRYYWFSHQWLIQ